jgi:hypothetical protein
MRKSSSSDHEHFQGQHRFEHWYRDNSVYFITARYSDKYPAFEREAAQQVFWDRFEHWSAQHGFFPWVTTLMNNHYHTMGYLRKGEQLGEMMRKIHGSVAKLVNDLLPQRRVPFWHERGARRDYFDGCLRNETQCRRTYDYVLNQSVKARSVRDYRDYPNTRVKIDLDRGLRRALKLKSFLPHVPYKRYER